METGKRMKSHYLFVFLLFFWPPLMTAFGNANSIGSEKIILTSFTEIDTTLHSPSPDSLYLRLLSTINLLLSQKKYEECRKELEKALSLKPEDPSLKEKMIRIQGLIAQQRKTDEEFEKIISSAETYYGKKDYLNAKSAYQMAIDIKPEDDYARERLKETMELIRSQKAQNILYDVAIASADKLFDAQEYSRAKEEYENAVRILPAEDYPKEKINQIIKIQVDAQVQDELYLKAIASADKLFAALNYPAALQEYQQALKQKPWEVYPQQKINELNKILAEIKAIDESYQRAIASADKFFHDQRYTEARSGYDDALKIKPKENYPAVQIREIDRILASIALTDQNFDRLINLADSFYINKNFIRARQNYQQALLVKPNDSYPQAMLIKTEAGIKSQESDKTAMEEAYRSTLLFADSLFSLQIYDQALTEYKNALALKPESDYPQTKINEIKSLRDELLVKQKELNAKYDRVIANADRMMSDQLYEQAKVQYQSALILKPAEEYPADKIQELDGILANLAQQKDLDNRYERALTEANKLFNGKNWEPARTAYQKALEIKPQEKYPTGQIRQIDSLLLALANRQAAEERYQQWISVGDSLLLQIVAYSEAKQAFSEASAIKPSEKYPRQKIHEIESILMEQAHQQQIEESYSEAIRAGDSLLKAGEYRPSKSAFQMALNVKPSESYPVKKMEEIDHILAELAKQESLNAQYNEAILKADQLLAANEFNQSKTVYQQASTLKPEMEYPKQQVLKIEKKLTELAQQQALDREYAILLSEAEKQFAMRAWDSSKVLFTRATGVKPEESLPRTRIRQIDSTLMALAAQQALDEQYNVLITKADKLFRDKNFTDARNGYIQASEVKPSERYPKEKVVELDNILADIARKEAIQKAYTRAISNGDSLLKLTQYLQAKNEFQAAAELKPVDIYPKDKIREIDQILAELEGKKQTYDKLISHGDQSLAFKEYIKARDSYQQASDIFPEEKYPKEQIRFTTIRIDSIYRANKADYDKAIGEGDGFFNTFEYDKAIDAYSRALAFLPMEQYPQNMITKIRNTIAENAIVDVVTKPVVIQAGEEEKFSFNPVNIASRRNNFIYLKATNLSGSSLNILIRYGKDEQTNGGLAIRNLTVDGAINERLISVKDQDPWYREDNNWISIYPQGGDVEVSFIQVSRAIR